jgi:hypothetical protein
VFSLRSLIVSVDEDKFCYSYSVCPPLVKPPIQLFTKLRVSWALQCKWRLQPKKTASMSYSKVRVAIILQRRWRAIMTSKERDLFREQLESIRLLRRSFVGISRLFSVGVISIMNVVYSQSPGHGSASICICPQVCLEISVPCVKVTRMLLNISSAALLVAYNNVPLPLDEEWSKLLHGWLPLVNQLFNEIIDTLSNLHCHSLEDDSCNSYG